MKLVNSDKFPLALGIAFGVAVVGAVPATAEAAKPAGTYVTGDFHNHTTCSDGAISMQKLINRSVDKLETPWGLDWFAQAGHGGNGNRNCTLAEDGSLGTPAFPFEPGMGPQTTWSASIGADAVKGNTSINSTTPMASDPNPRMWRWQSIQEYQYPLAEYLSVLKGVPVFMGVETNPAGHEHVSSSIVTGQLPAALDNVTLPSTPGYTPIGNAAALSEWVYCFDRSVTDNSLGGGQAWDCRVPGSANEASPDWNPVAAKLVPVSGAGVGERGHLKTLESLKWMATYHPDTSYYVPAHLERPGPFNPDGNNGYNIEHLRNFNNTAPRVAFGFESQPGHHASGNRGEYRPERNTIAGVRVDSVGGTTYGGTGVYAAQVGGVWDALLGEGRNWWFFGSSDWHARGSFHADDRRTTGDFFPGEYQRDFVMVRHGADPKLRPEAIVDGLRSGNSFVVTGQLIDRLAFIACASYPGIGQRSNDAVQQLAIVAAKGNTDIDLAGCATMGEKLKVRPGAEVVVGIVVRDPQGANHSPYSFANPSLAQVGINQPLHMPELDHLDVVRGMVTGYRQPGSALYAGAWPNTWLHNPDLATVPAGAKNTSAEILRSFNATSWTSVTGEPGFLAMTLRVPVQASQYLRLRGSNLPPSVPFETDADGNPLADLYTNSGSAASLSIPCTVTGTNVPANNVLHDMNAPLIDGCPNHLPVIDGVKYVANDVAAWADLWFYSNPIFVEVGGSTVVAGVK